MSDHAYHSTRRRSRARLLLPFFCGGLILAGLGLGVQRALHRTESVSSVARRIEEIIRREPGGGPVGPWFIHADQTDPVTGDFLNLTVRSGSIQLGARRARLFVDPVHDEFSLELLDVVYTRVPDEDEQQDLEHHLLRLDRFTLGPAPYDLDIVPDHEKVRTRRIDPALVEAPADH